MATQLTQEDKQKLLKGGLYGTRKIGDKPYESGYWGDISSRDYVLVELLDESGTLIDYKDLTIAEAGIEIVDNNFKLLPGSHLTAFGFETGIFTIRYRFIRNLAGVEKPMLLRTKAGFEDNIFQLNSDASNIYITDDKKIFAASEEDYKANPDTTERLFLTNYKYEIDAISPSRTEVRIKAKNIFDNSYLGAYNYRSDFLKLQESTKTDFAEGTIEFVGVYDIPNNFSAGSPPPPVNFDITKDLKLTPNDGGFVFTQNMEGGTITLPNAYLLGFEKTPVRTQLNIIPNNTFENIEIDLSTGEPMLIEAGWDESLHSDAVKVKNWTSGFLGFSDGGTFDGSSAIGYHAKFVRNEGNSGGTCLKFIDQNDVFVDLDEWPTLQTHRDMQVQTEFGNLDSFGATGEDIMNISLDMKSTVLGKGVEIQLEYPTDLFIESEPTNPPEGYFDPFATEAPNEPIPENPPEGYLANTAGNASTIEEKPPSKMNQIISHFGLSSAPNINEGDDTSLTVLGGAGAWKVTNYEFEESDQGATETYTWGPNLGVEYTKEGELSNEEEWRWNGEIWETVSSFNSPSAPDGTVSPVTYPTAVNTHPYQREGVGVPNFPRNTTRGLNSGWHAGTVTGETGILLFKDDLIWQQKHKVGNFDNYKVYKFDEYFPGVRNETVSDDDGTRTIYEDIFANGRITGVSRIRKRKKGPDDSGSTPGIRSGYFLISYTNGSGKEDCNRIFIASSADYGGKIGGGNFTNGSDNPGPNGANDDGVVFWKDLDPGFNTSLNENGGDMAIIARKSGDKMIQHFFIKGSGLTWRQGDGDGDFFEKFSNGFFDADYPKSIEDEFDIPAEPEVGFGYGLYSGHWSAYSMIADDVYYKFGSDATEGPVSQLPVTELAPFCGEFWENGDDIIYGSRNPSADNYNADAIYDDGSSIFSFDTDPYKVGATSPENQWTWDGEQWNSSQEGPVFNYETISSQVYSNGVGGWDNYQTSIEIPTNWNPLAKWYFTVKGHNAFSGDNQPGVVWVDNLYADFTLSQQEISTPIYRDFTAKIINIVDATTIRVNKSYEDRASELVSEDTAALEPTTNENPVSFSDFKVSYLVYNPFDLRTYLKFGNQMFLTTNFKKDRVSNGYPFSVVYKLYEPLPDNVQRLDEVVIAKEMADTVEETLQIVDFVDTEVGDVVLKTPDLSNVESPIQRVTTNYKNQTQILSEDSKIAESLRNEFLSQSIDSVEINVDYSKFKNFANFSSVKSRIENFKYKLEQIEAQTAKSASFVGVSGSAEDMTVALNKINEYKNGFDGFEKYMYFESSSFVSSSLGVFYDNAWPKTGGDGSFENPYVLAGTKSDEANVWYIEQTDSASIYDTDNFNKLSNLLPEHIKANTSNETFLRMTDMFGHHFDDIWLYIKALGDTYDRREKLTEGISKDLLESVAKSLGWQLNDGKSSISLSRYALGKEVTGSSFSNYSTKSERDVSREIWSRIVNNMPYFLKNKGTIRAIKGLISAYGIPSTILRVREYGGPDLPDNAVPQFEIGRKFTKALGFRGAQFVSSSWKDDSDSGRKPDTIEFRFKSPTGSNQILVEKAPIDPNVSSSFYIRLKDNNSVDNYGCVSFQISGSDGMKEITSSNLPVYDNDFYSVMVRRTSGSDNPNVSQSFELSVGKYDAGRSKIHLYSTSTLVTDVEDSASYNANWETDGNIYIGGSGSAAVTALIGAQLSGSVMEYRHWTEVLNTGSFKNHIANPKAYNGNSLSSSYENLVLRYSFDDDKDLSSDTDGIRDVSANQTFTMPGVHNGFTGNFFGNVVDETKSNVPSIGAMRRVTNKIRIEKNIPKPGAILSYKERATKSAYDLAPVDSNKVGVYFAPTDVINTDIIESVANLNFDNFLGDPRDVQKLEYRGLKDASNNYWKKYTGKNDFWDYIRLLKYYDQSIFPQIRKMIPARAKASLGILIEPNIFERPKVVIGKDPVVETPMYRDTIKVPDFVEITSSFNHDRFTVTGYDAYNSTINLSNIDSGSNAVISMSAVYKTYNGEVREFLDESYKNTIWQRIGEEGIYKSGSVTSGDVKFAEVLQPMITGSRIYGNNQKLMKFYNHPTSASLGIINSSSFKDVDIDNLVDQDTAKFNSFYAGVKNTKLTTFDGGPPIEVTITSPTRLVKSKGGESSLDTGEGKVAKFFPKRKKKKKGGFFQNSFAKKKPTNIQKAIKQAEEDKGDFLTLTETMKVVNKFKKDNNLKK